MIEVGFENDDDRLFAYGLCLWAVFILTTFLSRLAKFWTDEAFPLTRSRSRSRDIEKPVWRNFVTISSIARIVLDALIRSSVCRIGVGVMILSVHHCHEIQTSNMAGWLSWFDWSSNTYMNYYCLKRILTSSNADFR